MKIEEVKAMSDEQLRVKVAELCGWYRCNKSNPCGGWHNDSVADHPNQYAPNPPNYPADLNVMHKAEEFLNTSMLRADYQEKLALLGPKDAGVAGWYWIHATARQRAEAFILTLSR